MEDYVFCSQKYHPNIDFEFLAPATITVILAFLTRWRICQELPEVIKRNLVFILCTTEPVGLRSILFRSGHHHFTLIFQITQPSRYSYTSSE